MPKSFEELQIGSKKLLQGIANPTGAISKPPVGVGWAKAGDPERETHYVTFLPVERPDPDKQIFIGHCYTVTDDLELSREIGRVIKHHLDKTYAGDARVIVHGHAYNVPCFTPDGCFEI
jgi:hypothetical protein